MGNLRFLADFLYWSYAQHTFPAILKLWASYRSRRHNARLPFMAQAEVYSADAIPRVDRPLYFQKTSILDGEVRAGSVRKIGPRCYQLLKLTPRELNFRLAIAEQSTAYDRSARTGSKAKKQTPWQIWMFHFDWERPLEWTNGWPLRMRCGIGHIRDEADKENAARALLPKSLCAEANSRLASRL